MVGIVIVSHSQKIAEGVVELAKQMAASVPMAAAGGLEDGSIGIIVGTHALIEDNVIFRNLGLAIIDEQHRFGVEQRSKLWRKSTCGAPPHVLVMTATPIPRTLALTMYGDLDVSRITEMPKGRQRVDTFVVGEDYRLRLNDFIKKQIALGGQCYVVCPSIEKSEEEAYIIDYSTGTPTVYLSNPEYMNLYDIANCIYKIS